MTKKKDEKYKKICCSIAKNWKFSGDLITDFVRTRIEEYKKEGKWNPNFDDEELEKRFVDVVCCVGVGFETYLGKFGEDYFFRILDNWTMMAIDNEIKHRKKIFKQEKEEKRVNKKGGEK